MCIRDSNNSNDTLYYQDADCYNLLFSIKSNPYFHLADDVCHQSKYSKTALAPHRAQKMALYLTMSKIPDRSVSIVINMNLYKWANDQAKQSKELVSGNMSDSLVLHYDSNHKAYWPKDAFEVLDKKQRSILPDKDIYLLTNTDRKSYTLTVEKEKIEPPRDTIITDYKNRKTKKAKVITAPVILHNNSNDTLRFYSMTCSWYSFYGTNSTAIGLPVWACNKNIPQIITIAPHKIFERYMSIVYDSNIKSGNKYRISMSLLKVPDDLKSTWGFWPGEYVRFNKIWSNEITIL
nr:hypothetical protein [Mucilaginibacter sp. L294]